MYGWAGRWKTSSRVPTSTIWPRYITATRSQRCSTTARSWETNRIVKPRRRCRSRSRLRICERIDTSSADTGSSATRNFGSTARALAMPMRWRWPPLNSWGKRGRGAGRARRDRAPRPRAARCACRDPWARNPRRSSRRPSLAGRATSTGPGTRPGCSCAAPAARRAARRARSLAVEAQRSLVGVEQAQEDARQRRLAAPRLADEPEHLALEDVEVDVVDGATPPCTRPSVPPRSGNVLTIPRASTERESPRHALGGAPTRDDATSSTVASCAGSSARGCRRRARRGPASPGCSAPSARAADRRTGTPASGSRSVGPRPGITVSSSWRTPMTGTEPSKPRVYGCFGSAKKSPRREPPRRSGRRTSRRRDGPSRRPRRGRG